MKEEKNIHYGDREDERSRHV